MLLLNCMLHLVRMTCFMDYGGDVVLSLRRTQRCLLSRMECGIRQCKCTKMHKRVLAPVHFHIQSRSIIYGRIIGYVVRKCFKNGTYCQIWRIRKTIQIFYWSAPGVSLIGPLTGRCWKVMSTVSWSFLLPDAKSFLLSSHCRKGERSFRRL